MTEQSKDKTMLQKAKSWGKRIALAGLLFHAGTQLSYWANDIYQAINPSPLRANFQRAYNIPLHGWQKGIEEDPSNVLTIARVVEKERLEKPFQLNTLRINSPSYAKQAIWEQLEDIILSPRAGCYVPWLKNIILEEYPVDQSVVHHEIKHAKTFDVLQQHPNFLEEWSRFAIDENGESLYLTSIENICSRVRGLSAWIDPKKKESLENMRLGFVSDYARTNVYEDITELCEATEGKDYRFRAWLLGTPDNMYTNAQPPNQRIVGKVQLAEKYRIIPEGFSEYVIVEDLLWKSIGFHGGVDQEAAKAFMEASEQFLNRHPTTVYESKILSDRAYVMREGMYGYPLPHFSKEEAIAATQRVLMAAWKDPEYYGGALLNLANLEKWEERTIPGPAVRRSELWENAYQNYMQRFRQGDITILTRGVNDFLIAHGLLPPNSASR
ncbi:hypothetical protein HZB02_02085 [Candidatus Woesearchaeota archaeon]|nr:hypothetical protein [Candidatus Woesearchaeota archaeon]